MTDNNSDDSKWIGDGSEGGQLDVTPSADDSGGSTIIAFASATRGTPYNVRLDDDNASTATEADSYYEAKVGAMSEGSSLAVGLVTSDGFRPGWRTKGRFYNGNLTNGSAGLVIGFGERIRAGDVVGVHRRRFADGKCTIVFHHNGRCLGAGFSLEGTDERLHPCLHLSGSATVICSVPPPPTVFEREQPARDEADPYGGGWAIEEAFEGPELGRVPVLEGAILKMSFEKVADVSGVRYRLSTKISNSLRAAFEVTGKTEAFDKIEFVGPCMSTRMMPRPALRPMENLMQSALSSDRGFRKMIVTEEGRLILSGPTAEVICSRFVEAFDPVTSI